MARAIYNARELDPVAQIEDGIRKAFDKNGRAVVTFDAIEERYEIDEADDSPRRGTIDEKCDVLSKRLACTYTKDEKQQSVTFTRKRVSPGSGAGGDREA